MYKIYRPFDPFTPFDANTLIRQGRIGVANAAERDQIETPNEGMTIYRLDTHAEEIYTGNTWRIVPRVLGFALVEPQGAPAILPAALTPVAGLALTGMPTGAAMLLEVTVQAVNGQSGGHRFINIQAVNGETNVGPARRFSLPLPTNSDHAYSITHLVPVPAPTSGNWSLKLGADQASSVIVWQASLRLTHKP